MAGRERDRRRRRRARCASRRATRGARRGRRAHVPRRRHRDARRRRRRPQRRARPLHPGGQRARRARPLARRRPRARSRRWPARGRGALARREPVRRCRRSARRSCSDFIAATGVPGAAEAGLDRRRDAASTPASRPSTSAPASRRRRTSREEWVSIADDGALRGACWPASWRRRGVTLRLEKWQGAGNAYLLVERGALGGDAAPDAATLLCDVRTGIGADGVLVLDAERRARRAWRSSTPTARASEACGNGTRMVARWLARARPAPRRDGRDRRRRPALHRPPRRHRHGGDGRRARWRAPPTGPNGGAFPYPHRFVSVGNPHVTIPVADADAFPLDRDGPMLEHHAVAAGARQRRGLPRARPTAHRHARLGARRGRDARLRLRRLRGRGRRRARRRGRPHRRRAAAGRHADDRGRRRTSRSARPGRRSASRAWSWTRPSPSGCAAPDARLAPAGRAAGVPDGAHATGWWPSAAPRAAT